VVTAYQVSSVCNGGWVAIMTFDENGYPDDDTIKQIETFDLGRRFGKTAEFIRLIWNNWEHANVSWTYNQDTGCLQMSTCGRSGNEEVIAAMRHNYSFWVLFWYRSQRGGYYWFKLYVYDSEGNRTSPNLDFLEVKK